MNRRRGRAAGSIEVDGAAIDVPLMESRLDLELVGPPPLALDADGRPLNPAGCVFFKGGPISSDTVVMSRPNHTAGVIKMAAILAHRMGEGVADEAAGLARDRVPGEERLDFIARLLQRRPENPGEESLKRKASESYGKHVSLIYRSYAPLVIRGRGDDAEVCVRKDAHISLDDLGLAIGILESKLNVPSGKVKAIAFASVNDQSDAESVRDHFERIGELWRLYPPTRSEPLQREYIDESKIRTRHGITLYYAGGSGQRLLTEEQLKAVVSPFIENPAQAGRESVVRQMRDLVSLARSVNRVGVTEVSFFMADYGRFGSEDLAEAAEFVQAREGERYKHGDREASSRLSEMLAKYHDATADGFHSDDSKDSRWRQTMYHHLIGAAEGANFEETHWGLSKEFVGEVEWLPGARIASKAGGWTVDYHKDAGEAARVIIGDFEEWCRGRGGALEHINVGSVIESRSKREKTSDQRGREVYVVEWRMGGEERNRVSFVRRQHWNERHFLRGLEFDLGGGRKAFFDRRELERLAEEKVLLKDEAGPYVVRDGRRVHGAEVGVDRARRLSEEYTKFVLDRNRFSRVLDPGHPEVEAITYLKEGKYYAVYFVRSYTEGIAADKIPHESLRNPDYARGVCRLMGGEAARNMVLGRIAPFTGSHLFGDGDEIIRLSGPVDDPSSMPVDLVRNDETAVLGDVDRPFETYLPTYARWLDGILSKAAKAGLPRDGVRWSAEEFFGGFSGELKRLKAVLSDDGVRNMFKDNPDTVGEREYGWVGCRYLVPKAVDRARAADADALTGKLRDDASLAVLRPPASS